MEESISKILDVVLSEYGVFVLVLLLGVVKLWMAKEKAEERNTELTDKLLEVVQGNTEAMTNLISKIDHQKEVSDAKSN